MKKNKWIAVIAAAVLCIPSGNMIRTSAEPDYTDTEYWTEKCLSSDHVPASDYEACQAYREYMGGTSEDLQKKLEAIESKRGEIESNISEYGEKIKEYQSAAEELTGDVRTLNAEVNELQAKIDDQQELIDEKQKEIDEKQQEIDKVSVKVKERMVRNQPVMRVNPFIDILMDSKSFDQLLRTLMGIRSITNSDRHAIDQIMDMMNGLKQAKKELEEIRESIEKDKEEAEVKRNTVVQKQQDLIEKRYEAQVIQEAFEKQYADLEAQGNRVATDIDSIQDTMNNLADLGVLDDIPDTGIDPNYEPEPTPEPTPESTPEPTPEPTPEVTPESTENPEATETPSGEPTPTPEGTENPEVTPTPETTPEATPEPTPESGTGAGSGIGWVHPVPGAYRSAGTWYYSGGGVHLGIDLAGVPQGTTIRAVANGVVIKSADGCRVGYLGSGCVGTGGSWGGGNQVFLLSKVNGGLYAIKYCHMQYGSPIKTGTIVNAGDYVGRLGATGNVTGPHVHIEIMYLGDASNFANYARTWNGDLAFGCGWTTAGLRRRCDSGVGAPCRIRPETVFGY